MRTIFALVVLSLLCSCASVHTVRASTPAFSLAECSLEEFVRPGSTSQPDKSQVYEAGPDYLEFASPVCRSNTPDAHVLVSYTTKFPHSVQVVNLQMGSGVHTILEWSMWVYFDTPDDHHYALSRQFDKHEDFRGNELTNIPVRWNLPAGTIITIDRPHAECVADPDGAGLVAPGSCLTGQKVELVGL